MKKAVFLVIFFLVLSAAFAQVSPEDQWIIGTWVDNDGDIWTFRNDGTVTLSWDSTRYHYSINNFLGIITFIYQYRSNSYEYDIEDFFKINNTQMGITWGGDFYFLNKRN